MKRFYFLTFLLFIALIRSNAQISLTRSEKFDAEIQHISTHIYRIATTLDDGNVLIWHSPISDYEKKCSIAEFSPTGAYIAAGTSKGKVKLFRSSKKNDIFKSFNEHHSTITSLAFNNDGNLLISGDEEGMVYLWDTKRGKKISEMNFHKNAISSVGILNNGVIISADTGGHINFWKQDEFVKSYSSINAYPVDICPSNDGKLLAISFSDGRIEVWDQKNLEILYSTGNGNPGNNPVTFLPNSMYLAFTRQNYLMIYNCKKNQIETRIKVSNGDINALCAIVDNEKSESFVITGGSDKTINIWDVNGLEKRYDVLVKAYIDDRIEQWQKMKPGETAEEYNDRVTEFNRQRKLQEYSQQITNELALNRYSLNLTDISKFDNENQTFALTIDSTYDVVISVPYERSSKFYNSFNNLSARNPRFVLNDFNDFDLAYIEILNPETGNYYVFDQNDKYVFDPTAIDIEYAPTRIIAQVAQKEDILKQKLEIIEEKITDNVQTNVTANAIVEENNQGEKELNFHVEYSYEIIKATIQAQTDDFPLGEYKFTASNAARMTLQVFKESLEYELAEYLRSGKKVTIKITGSTDATPIVGKIPYTGDYDVFIDEPYFLNNNLESITITPETGITTNKQLAFLRTIGVRRFIENYIDILKNTNNFYHHYAELSDKKGGEYRRIAIELIIHNAFQGQEYLPDRLIHDECLSDVDEGIPETDQIRGNSYALVIGNEDYSSFQTGLSKEADVHYAINDAERVAEYFNKTIGIPDRQVKLLKNATASQIGQGISWLMNLAQIENGNAEIYLYYSGHGLPDETTKEPFIIPVDVSASDLTYAMKLKDIYNQLSSVTTKKTIVLLDACFSGGAREKPLLEKRMVKVVPNPNFLSGNLILMTSSQGNESSGYLEDKCHGIFTYFLLKKLKETKGNITHSELFDYVKRNVQKESALQGDLQTPKIKTGYNMDGNMGEWFF